MKTEIQQALPVTQIIDSLLLQRGMSACIRWDYIVKLYERNVGVITQTPGLSMVPKLKYEHIKLTSFSKMRVDLAAEVTIKLVQSCNNIIFPHIGFE